MLLNARRAASQDAGALVRLYDEVYRGGYSACFGKYGPIAPEDFWWVQSEKEVSVLEVNREPVGLLVIGRERGRLLVEEVLAAPRALPAEARTPDGLRTLAERALGVIQERFQEARDDRVRLRTTERNPLGMQVLRTGAFTLTDALIVSARHDVSRGRGARSARSGASEEAVRVPEGYAIRRAQPGQDEAALAALDEECLGGRVRSEDLGAHLARPHVRAFLALREGIPAGFVIALARDRASEWRLGVREAHRRRGVGTALARTALQALAARGIAAAVGTHWAADVAAEAFGASLGFATERVYLYCERAL